MKEPQNLFHKGEKITLEKLQERAFFQEKALYFIEKGTLDIYYKTAEANAVFLATRSKGHILLGGESIKGAFYIQALQDVELFKISFEKIEKNALLWIASEIMHTAKALSASLLYRLQEHVGMHATFKPGEKISFEEKKTQHIRPYFSEKKEAISYALKVRSGKMQIADLDQKIYTAESFPLLFFREFSIYALTPVEIEIFSIEQMLQERAFAGAVQDFIFLLEEMCLQFFQKKAAGEVAESKQLETLNQKALQESVFCLASILQAKTPSAFVQKPCALVESIQKVAAALGIVVTKAPPYLPSSLSVQEKIEKIAYFWDMPFRKVEIDPSFYGKDVGPLLVFRKKNRKPLSLLPKRACQYEVIDCHEKTKTPLQKSHMKEFSSEAYVFYKTLPEPPKGMDLLRYSVEKNGKDFLTTFLAGLGSAALLLYIPLGIGWIFGQTFADQSFALLYQIAVGFVFVAIGSMVFSWTESFALLRIESIVSNKMQSGMWQRVLHLPLSFFRRFTAGDLMQRVSAIDQIRQVLHIGGITGLFSGLFSLMYLAVMCYRSIELTVMTTLPLAVGSFLYAIGAAVSIQKTEKILDKKGKLYAFLVEMMSGITKIRLVHAENRAFYMWSKAFAKKKQEEITVQKIAALLRVFKTAMQMMGTLLLYYGFAKQLQHTSSVSSSLSLGAFLSFFAAYGAFSGAIFSFIGEITGVLTKVVSLWKRAKPVFEEPLEMPEKNGLSRPIKGDIFLEKLSFRYSPSTPLLLSDISLQIEHGSYIAIVGPSGAGKSTLFKLLLGFFSPEKGKIFFDGVSMENRDIIELRKQIGVVLQDSAILGGSLRENILCGRYCTDEEITHTLALCGFADELEKLPMGLDTFIPEGGSNLSGGMKQRLLIARAIIKKPKILLLDEATSALDNLTQEVVRKNLDELQMTRIVIAHRMSTIVDVDTIYVLDRGKIVQSGSFQELVEQEGLFQSLVEKQSF